ncbi:MAG: hypothetical protein CSA36_05610 [Draconibacterium sp.]|nr:MAG: hypothetical protein CSA36_05610 [Draconibacterium sp.]
MPLLAIILFIILGLVLLLIEFAVIPGVTIAGIGGLLLLAGSIIIAFKAYGNFAGFLTLLVVIIVAPLMLYYFFKSRSGKKMILDSQISGKVKTINTDKIKPGETGKTIGRLAPSGKVKINGEVLAAQSTGAFIDQQTEIKVLKVLSNKIIVEPLKKE